MSLLLTRTFGAHTVLGIWQLSETVEELITILPAHVAETDAIGQAHPRRRQEWLASRALAYELLKKFTPAPLPLHRSAHGKPYFAGADFRLSITHSPVLAAVILSAKYEVGIDVELIGPKALRVAGKFLTEAEQQHTAGTEERSCLYWSAKETLYKLYSRKQLIFKDNLFIEPSEQENVLLGRVQTENFSKLYRIYHETLHGHVLTYCLDDVPL